MPVRRRPVNRPGDVVVIGDALLDVVVVPSARPIAGGDVPAIIRIGPGGQGANVAVRLARRGVAVHLLCALGDDHAGGVARASLRADGVDLVAMDAPATGIVAVVLGSDGERSMMSQRAPFDGVGQGSGGFEALAAGAAWLVVSGYLLLQHGAPELAAAVAGIPTRRAVLGCSLGPEQSRAWSRAVARARPELLVLNADEARAVIGASTAPAREVADLFRCVAVVTRRDGAEAAAPEGWVATVDVPTQEAHATDSTGAGDAFSAALIHGLLAAALPLAREDVSRAMRDGVALAAMVARVAGAQGRVAGERAPHGDLDATLRA